MYDYLLLAQFATMLHREELKREAERHPHPAMVVQEPSILDKSLAYAGRILVFLGTKLQHYGYVADRHVVAR